jgi:hypothetical protein
VRALRLRPRLHTGYNQDDRVKALSDDKLAAMLEVRDANMEAWSKVEKASKGIKEYFEQVRDGVYRVGNFIITRKLTTKRYYNVPDDVRQQYEAKREEFRNSFERFQASDAAAVYKAEEVLQD